MNAQTVFTQRNFVADFLQEKCDFRGKTADLNIALFRFVTMHAFDRRTDRRTDGQNSHRKTASAFHAAR